MPHDTTPRWLITGCSSGLGRALATEAASRGHHVLATARRRDDLDDLAALPGVRTASLDVTDPDSIRSAVTEAENAWGGLDVLVNNAGYSLRGALEEWDPADLRALYDVNVFGVVDVTAAALPSMRRDGRGVVVLMSSVGGVRVTAGGSAYASTKFALEALGEGLAADAGALGIRTLIVEPGPFRTDFAGRSNRWSAPLSAYDETLAQARDSFTAQHGEQPGDPARAARVIADAVEDDDAPLRLPLGPQAIDGIAARLRERLAEVESLPAAARSTSFGDA